MILLPGGEGPSEEEGGEELQDEGAAENSDGLPDTLARHYKSFFTSMRPGDMILTCNLSTDFHEPSMMITYLARRVDAAWESEPAAEPQANGSDA